MRLYPVPFTTKGEEKLMFNLTARQIAIISVGTGIGLVAVGILSKVLKTFALFCFPVALPFIGVSVFLALAKIKKHGREMSMGEYVLLSYRYKNQPKHYLRIREEVD